MKQKIEPRLHNKIQNYLEAIRKQNKVSNCHLRCETDFFGGSFRHANQSVITTQDNKQELRKKCIVHLEKQKQTQIEVKMLDSALDHKMFVYNAARDNNLGALKVSKSLCLRLVSFVFIVLGG